MSVRLLCIWLGHLWTLAAGGDKAIEYSACRFSPFIHMHSSISASASPMSSILHTPSRRRCFGSGALSYLLRTAPSRLSETTTQFTRLLSTPEKTFTNTLPVTERQLPAYSLTRRPHTLSFRSSTPKQRNGKQQAADYSKQHYLSQTLIAANSNHHQHYYNISPSTAAGSNATGTADS